MRTTVLVATALATAAVALAGCGGSSDSTVGGGFTVPSDVHDVYGEVEAVLDQLPYQSWYTKCVVAKVRKSVSPKEGEELAELSESARESKASRMIAGAGPACEKATGRPVIDPNASEQELELYRAGILDPIKGLAEKEGLDSEQVSCVEGLFEELPIKKVVALGNGSDKVREAILLSVFKPCAKVK